MVAVNEALNDQPDLLNQDAFNNYLAIFEGTIDGEVMDADAYAAKIAK